MRFSRTVLAVILVLVILCPVIGTAQQQVVGRVIDRSGAPLPRCLVEFFSSRQQPPMYRSTTNNDGYINISVQSRPYLLRVSLGQREQWFDVTVDGAGLHPPTIRVNW